MLNRQGNQGQHMTIRLEEQLCQEAFTAYLAAKYNHQPIKWVPEPNGKATPPDFHLHYHSMTYAVEVTTLMSQFEQTEGKSISELGVWKITESLAADIEQEMSEKDLLSGLYILTLDGPYDFFRSSIDELKTSLKEFIIEPLDQDVVTMGTRPRVTTFGQSFFLQKVGVMEKAVGIVTMGGNEGWQSEVVKELFSLVQDAISSKAQKLRALDEPWVLLLFDQHHLATAKEYAMVRDQLSCIDCNSSAHQQFLSVYIINAGRDVFCLHPLEDRKCWDSGLSVSPGPFPRQ
jgi:hypothetical protein